VIVRRISGYLLQVSPGEKRIVTAIWKCVFKEQKNRPSRKKTKIVEIPS